MLILGAVLAGFVLVAPGGILGIVDSAASAPRASRVSTSVAAPLLEVRDLGKRFGGLTRARRRLVRGRGRRDGRRHGRQRRRQDDALQPDRRQRAAELRERSRFDGAPHRRPLARPDLPPRRRPHVPDRQAVPRPDGAREPAHRGDVRPRRARTTAPRPIVTAMAVLDEVGIGDARRGAGGDAHPRRPEAARGRARHRHRRAPRPARRGDGRPDARPRWRRCSRRCAACATRAG